MILGQQSRQRRLDGPLLVAGRYDGDDGGPGLGRQGWLEPLIGPPEAAAKPDQMDPGRERKRAKQNDDDVHWFPSPARALPLPTVPPHGAQNAAVCRPVFGQD